MLKEGVSIIVCCYNSSSRINTTLQYIAAQQIKDIPCEVIVVDNASTDGTAEVAKLTWHNANNMAIKFNLICEPLPGLTYARKKGMEAAGFEFLIFCDDDNWLDENYVQNTFRFFKTKPEVAILGGIGIAEFENPQAKPPWFDDFYHGYAVGPQGENESHISNVYGAGMAIRKSVLENTMGGPMFLHGRKKDQLTSGEDAEICFRIRLAGHQILYSEDLTFKHFLAISRLSWGHLKKLHGGFARARVVISLYEKAINSNDLKLSFFYWLRKALYYWGIYLKYWPGQYSVYKKGEGSMAEIHHIAWKNIALSYCALNFKTISIYRKIAILKKNKF